MDRSRDLPEDVAFGQSHAAVWRSRPSDGGAGGRHGVRKTVSLLWTGDMGAFSFSRVDTKGEVGCAGPEQRTRVNLDITHIVRRRGQCNTKQRGILKTAY